jgi:hypothetical protein
LIRGYPADDRGGNGEPPAMKRSYEHVNQATACRMCRPTANPGLIGGGLPIRSSLLNTVAAFDFGAQAERIRQTGRGWLLPPGINSAALNDALLAIAQQTGHEWTGQIATIDCALMPS